MNEYKIFARTIEETVLSQVEELHLSPVGQNAKIRIMPDCHSGKGCVIGTTMKIIDKVCPNIVGVDIGCGVTLAKTNIKFEDNLELLDGIIHKYIPSGFNVHNSPIDEFDLSSLKCKLSDAELDRGLKSIGTLGGGNHFIEAYRNGYIAVHTGSRNIGLLVAKHYQTLAKNKFIESKKNDIKKILEVADKSSIQGLIMLHKLKTNNNLSLDLTYLENEDMNDYLHDMKIMQEFASLNRNVILSNIVSRINGEITDRIETVHNYIDTKNMILRKGAVSSNVDEKLVIPLNMRDGLLICVGKGNEDWNNSAPHGAGRLYSRARAKKEINIDDFQDAMKHIYSTCVNKNTIDESPFAYKDYKEIMEMIEPTVNIIERIVPVYNFKSN